MKDIFINLKRFDVPKKLGGLCLTDDPAVWIKDIMKKTVELGIGKYKDVAVSFMLPEGLVIPAKEALAETANGEGIGLGVQSTFRADVTPGGNFGAFSANIPAAAAKSFGCTWSMIGHSEERKDKFEMMCRYEPKAQTEEVEMTKANTAVSSLLNEQNICALKRDINVLFCVGETAEEKGEGDFEEQKPRIESVLKAQLEIGLKGMTEVLGENRIVIGYEPRWAIGPGKTPPGADYIGFVSDFIKKTIKSLYGMDIGVVYGGGLKEDNAKMISDIPTIDGGLVALTKFTGDIAFEPSGLKTIIDMYLS